MTEEQVKEKPKSIQDAGVVNMNCVKLYVCVHMHVVDLEFFKAFFSAVKKE